MPSPPPSPAPTPPHARGAREPLDGRTLLIASLLVAALTGLVFGPVLGARALSLDDDDYITHNELVTRPSFEHALQFFREPLRPTTVGGYWMPLSMTSLMLDVAQGGNAEHLAPFHRTSLAFHLLATLALLGLLLLLFGRPLPAVLGALAFALHPLAVEPVAWVGERKTVLAGALALGAAAAHVAWVRRRGTAWRVGSAVLFAAALLSKPTATPLPLLLLLLDHWPLRRLDRQAVIEKWPLYLLAATSTGITLVSHAHSATLEIGTRAGFALVPLQAAARLVFYAGKLIWPASLSCIYPDLGPFSWTHPGNVFALLAVVASSTLAVVGWRSHPAFAVLWGWFLLTLAPVLGWFDYSWVTLSDKYLYVGLAGAAIALTGLLGEALRRTRARPAIVAAALALLVAEAAATRVTLAHWRDSLTLWEHIASVAPFEAGAQNGLGSALLREQRWPEARERFRRAAELSPGFWVAQVNVSITALQAGDLTEAENSATRAAALMPRGVDALLQAAAVAMARERPDEATPYLQRALEVHPFDVSARLTLAQALEAQGRIDESLLHVRRVLATRPGMPLAEFGLGHLLIRTRGFDAEARAHLEAAVRSQADALPAMNELAWWLAATPDPSLRDTARALALATRASQLAGDTTASVLDTRAVAEAAAGRFAEAVRTEEAAIAWARREAGDSAARVLEGRLALFRRRTPWREPPR